MARLHNEDHRFKIQHISNENWIKTSLANAAIDYLHGYKDLVCKFLDSREEEEIKTFKNKLFSMTDSELKDHVNEVKSDSLQFIVMMLTGACNADCTICFTDRKKKPMELEIEHKKRILKEASELGAKYVYIPGEGEPTIDEDFWDFLETCKSVDMQAVIFTNGIIFSDEKTCMKYWNMTIDEAINKLKNYPVSFYFKLWSTSEELVGEMMKIDNRIYNFSQYDDVNIPQGLIKLLNSFPRNKVGIEVVVERRNVEEIIETIIPFAEKHQLSRIVEMLQHNGRSFGETLFDLNDQQAERVNPLLSPTSCSMATCKAVITSRGYLSPRIAILENQIPEIPVNIRGNSLYELLHSTDYIVNRRYDVTNCLCEQIPIEMATKSNSSFIPLPVFNIAPSEIKK
ncbi:radical SAM protein [Chengkuizengella axinellae]|uniref:Radical SAM protein n=1 Tax=Chengkuizengella axinellae TaxID=3064388 RepID=A0ABT9J674_9BACL|nr:radical SAM protein [Chengkuizengella sp. 2205SS18-9]MDP5277121.1 radical SAM protein [Chengkuizengella sp. 2205SS18-9]